jgi:hypothetical protein
MYDVDGLETVQAIKSVKSVYYLYVTKSINFVTTNKINVQMISTGSTITVELPSQVQVSNLPMGGSFKIKCALDKEGANWNTTIDIYAMNNTNQIRDRIVQACPNYREKIEVMNGPYYVEDGRDILIRFVGLNYDVPQMEIIDS